MKPAEMIQLGGRDLSLRELYMYIYIYKVNIYIYIPRKVKDEKKNIREEGNIVFLYINIYI